MGCRSMKYGNISAVKQEQFHIPALHGGISFSEEEFIEDNQLGDCNNMWFKEGALRTRLGISAVEDSVIGRYDKYSSCIAPFKMTDSTVFIDGKKYAVAYCLDGDNISYELLRVFFVDGDGGARETAAIYLNRLTSELFYRFSDVLFFSAASTVGGGIYAFVKVADGEKKVHKIYEINSDFNGWTELLSNEYYIPIIYMNGRGNRFPENNQENIYYSAEPTEPEALNMLTSRFKAYFTSDGYSSAFKLPISNLDDDTVICKVYHSPSSYTQWIINAGSNTSPAVFNNSTTVNMVIDRTTGIFSFNYAGTAFALPYMDAYGGNNIEFTSFKSTENALGRIVGSKRCVSYNSRLYFCGNEYAPNEVYSARISAPLYFPVNAKVSVGEATSAVTTLGVVCNKLIAFKPTEIYKINLTVGDSYTPDGILSGQRAGFMHNDTLTTTAVHSFIGCDCPDTLKNCSNRLVWLSSTGKVYTLATTTYGKENNIYEVSSHIEEMLKGYSPQMLKKTYAADTDGYYMLILDKKIAVMDYRIKDFGFPAKYAGAGENSGAISWYIWNYCIELDAASVAKIEGNILFACNSEDLKYQYVSRFYGEKDIIVKTDEKGNAVFEEYDISSGFSSAYTDLGHMEANKTVDEIYIGLKLSGATELKVTGDRSHGKLTLFPKNEKYEVSKIILPIKSSNRIKISLSSKDRFAVGGIIIKYRPI